MEKEIIPSTWSICRLDEVFQIARGGSPRPIIDYITEGDGYNWIKIGDTKNVDKYIYKTKQKILKEGLKKSLLVKEDDFILSNSMSFGKPYIMKTEGCIHDGWLLMRKLKEDISVDFMYYVLSSDFIKTQFTSKAAGSTVQNLNIKLVETVKALIPPLPEQQKIAEILSTVDAKIEVIDQQITETQALKKGLMQQLLTGKLSVIEKRPLSPAEMKDSALGEIPKSWEVVSLEDVCDVIDPHPSHRAPKEDSNGYPFVGIGDISEDGTIDIEKARKISQEDVEKQKNTFELEDNDMGFGRVASIGKVVWFRKQVFPYAISPTMALIKAKKVEPKFCYQYLSSSLVTDQFRLLSVGSTRTSIGMKSLRTLKFVLPNVIEQRKIYEILNSADEKLEVLSEKKTHYQELKQGLMQQLLTGKIRVSVNEKIQS